MIYLGPMIQDPAIDILVREDWIEPPGATMVKALRHSHACFLRSPRPLGRDYLKVAPNLRASLTRGKRNQLASRVAVSDFAADNVADIIFEFFTRHADFEDPTKPNPILASPRWGRVIIVNGVPIGRRKWNIKTSVGKEQEQATLRAHYRLHRDKALAGEYHLFGQVDERWHRRWLTKQLRKYRLRNDQFRIFKPADLPDEEPLPHRTVLGPDPFTVATNTDIDSYTGPGGITYFLDNTAETVTVLATTNVPDPVGGGAFPVRCLDTIGTDHYSQFKFNNYTERSGPLCRYDGTCVAYIARAGTGTMLLLRRMTNCTGSMANVDNHSPVTMATGDSIRQEWEGTNYDILLDTGSGFSSVGTGSDTTYQTQTQVGFFQEDSQPKVDDWEGGDLGGAAAVSLIRRTAVVQQLIGR